MKRTITAMGILAIATGAACGCSSSESTSTGAATCETARRETCVQAFACSGGKPIKADASSTYATLAECQAAAPAQCALATTLIKSTGKVEPNWDACTKAIQSGAGTCAANGAGENIYTLPKPVCAATDPSATADAAVPAACSQRLPPVGVIKPGVYRLDDINLGDLNSSAAPDPEGWSKLGYNLDGLCTTQKSKDACLPASGGPPQRDGNAAGFEGVDNSFGSNWVSVLSSQFGSGTNLSLETRKLPNYVQIALGGTGTLYLSPSYRPLALANVNFESEGGEKVLSATVTPAALLSTMEGLDTPLCPGSGGVLNILSSALAGYADIMADGSNVVGTCDAISLGIGFSAAVKYDGAIPAPAPNVCN